MPVVSARESLPLDLQRDAPPSSAPAASGGPMSSNTDPAPPSPFRRPRRFAPLHTPLCLLRPLIAPRPGSSQPPILGFEPFQVPRWSPAASLSPTRHFRALQRFPLAVRRVASPRPLPSRRFLLPTRGVSTVDDGWEGSTSRLCSSDESVVRASVAAVPNPLLSWASFPSKVFSGRAARGGRSPAPSTDRREHHRGFDS